MIRSRKRAVSDYCFSCGGKSSLEVTVCTVIDCPLWWYRMGGPADTVVNITRVKGAIKRYPDVAKIWIDSDLEKDLLAKVLPKDMKFEKEKEDVQSP